MAPEGNSLYSDIRLGLVWFDIIVNSMEVVMIVVNSVTEAKCNLSALIEKAIAGQDIIISRARKPVAILSAYHRPKVTRKPGALRGKIRLAEGFDDLPSDIAEAFGAVRK